MVGLCARTMRRNRHLHRMRCGLGLVCSCRHGLSRAKARVATACFYSGCGTSTPAAPCRMLRAACWPSLLPRQRSEASSDRSTRRLSSPRSRSARAPATAAKRIQQTPFGTAAHCGPKVHISANRGIPSYSRRYAQARTMPAALRFTYRECLRAVCRSVCERVEHRRVARELCAQLLLLLHVGRT